MNVQSAINAGLFLQYVYNSWQAAVPGGLTGQAVTIAGAPIIPGSAYTVTQTLYCNDLSTDITPQPPGGGGWTVIGIVAVNNANPLDVVIAIRGTSNIWEWLQDAKFFPKPFSPVPGAGLTEDGFTDMYLSFSLKSSSNGSTFTQDLIHLIPAGATVTVTGHSLGSSLATLLALDLAAHANFQLAVFTLASPRTGDLTFEHVFNHTVLDCYRVVNRFDLVPKTPPPLLYFHVGDEVELVPGPEVDADIFCWHHLSTYLYLMAKTIGLQAQYPLQAGCKASAGGASQLLSAASGGQPG
jgi:hypothetical protein